MDFPVHLAFPLLSSFIYVAGALLLKRAAEGGAGAWRTASAANIATALVFAPLWAMDGPGAPPGLWWQPAVVALLFIAGQFSKAAARASPLRARRGSLRAANAGAGPPPLSARPPDGHPEGAGWRGRGLSEPPVGR
jgi:hypothetical protein